LGAIAISLVVMAIVHFENLRRYYTAPYFSFAFFVTFIYWAALLVGTFVLAYYAGCKNCKDDSVD